MKNPQAFSLILFLFLILISGCGHTLHRDPGIPAIEANYPTAEIMACGQRWHGLGACALPKGMAYADIGLGIQVYHQGTLVIDSKDCQLNSILSYNKTQVIPVHIPGVIDRNCVISMTVSPKYPGEEKQDIRVYSFRGHLLIRALEKENDEWEGYIRKVTNNFNSEIKLWVGQGVTVVRVVADGCGRSNTYDKKHPVINGWAMLDLKDLVPSGMLPKTCVIEGFARSGFFKDLLFSIMVSKYDPKFIPLPEPVVEMDGDKLICTANKAVSVISLNEIIKIDNKATFKKFNSNESNVLRLLTVNGRSIIGTWDSKKQKWVWMK